MSGGHILPAESMGLLKPAGHPHEGAQGSTSGSPGQQPQGHLVPRDPVGILAHDDVGHPGSCKAKQEVSLVGWQRDTVLLAPP